jgi:hypothetical protein
MVEADRRSRRGGRQGKQQGKAQACRSAAVELELEQGSGSNPRRPKKNSRHEVTGLSPPPRACQGTNIFPATAPPRIAANLLSPALRSSSPKDVFGATYAPP